MHISGTFHHAFLIVDIPTCREREIFYLTTHSTHFIYGYMASDIRLRTILIVRKETRCRHIGYSYRLTGRVLFYAPSHRQDNTYHGLCYTSRGALAGTRNSSMGPPQGSIRRPIAPWTNALPLSYVPLPFPPVILAVLANSFWLLVFVCFVLGDFCAIYVGLGIVFCCVFLSFFTGFCWVLFLFCFCLFFGGDFCLFVLGGLYFVCLFFYGFFMFYSFFFFLSFVFSFFFCDFCLFIFYLFFWGCFLLGGFCFVFGLLLFLL